MLYLVKMVVSPPAHMPDAEFEALKLKEKEASLPLQRSGVWRHVWRVAGAYANISIFDVRGHEHLHEIISALPFFPFLKVEVTPLVPHPSSIHQDRDGSSMKEAGR